MRRLLKFLHTLGAVGLMGGMAALIVLIVSAPAMNSPADYSRSMDGMAKIAAWIIMPSMVLTIIAGLLSIAVTPGFHDAGWAWLKAATGILIFEGGLHIVGPIQDAAKQAAGTLDSAGVARLFASERGTLWVLIAVSAANIALGVWRPRFSKLPI